MGALGYNSLPTDCSDGYSNINEHKADIALYPLYPLLVRAVAYIAPFNHFVAGYVLSNLCLVIACFYLYKMVLFEFHSEAIAWRTLKYLLIFPFTFFTGMVYTESMFLLFTIGCFYYMRRHNWLAAGVMGLLASSTRNQGILLLTPLVYEMFYHYKSQLPTLTNHARVQLIVICGFSLVLALSGFLAYLALNKYIHGGWFKFIEYQNIVWTGTFGFFAKNINGMVEDLLDGKLGHVIHSMLPAVMLFFYAAINILINVKKIPLSYTIYSLVFIVISFAPTWLIAGPRYILCLFPLHLMTALLAGKNKHYERVIDIIMIGLLVFYCFQFINGKVF